MSEKKKSKNGLFALGAKIGPKLFSLAAKLLKGVKFLKFGLAAVTFAGYSAFYSWKFALLIMIAVGFHESGHVWAMKKMGLKTKGFYFLPFIGGAAISEENYKTYGENVYIAIMGPIWGAFLAYVCAAAYLITGYPFLASAAGWMAVLNLFNLLPINPLDGGQLLRAIAFSIDKRAGFATLVTSLLGCIFCFWYAHIGLFLLLTIIGALDLIFEYHTYKKYLEYKRTRSEAALQAWMAVNRKYPAAMNKKQLLYTVGAYSLTLLVLFVLMFLMKHLPGADLAANFLS